MRLPRDLDRIAATLRTWREDAGSPSYGEIARRIAGARASGVGPGRSTVYDCFRDGRQRLDVDLAVDIARALGRPESTLSAWRASCHTAMHPARRESPVAVARGRPVLATPFIRRLDGIRTEGHVLLTGMPGVGKTQAAYDIAIRLLDNGAATDVLVLGLRATAEGEPPTAASILDAADNVLGMTSAGSVTERAAVIGDRLRAERWALILDDLTSPDQLEPLRNALRDVPLVMTSRVAMTPPGVTHLPLAPWNRADLLQLTAGVIGSERVDEDPASAAQLAETAQGLPLAAAVIAARIRDTTGWTLGDFVDDLRERARGLRHDAVDASIGSSYVALDPAARCVLRFLAIQPCATLSLAQTAAIAELDEHETRAAVSRLIAASLVLRGPAGRVGLHDLVRAFAADRAADEDPPRLREAALDRLSRRMIAEAWAVAAWRAGSSPLPASSLGIAPADLAVGDGRSWATASGPSAVELVLMRIDRRPDHAVELAHAATASLTEWSAQPLLGYELNLRAADAATDMGDAVGAARSTFSAGVSAVRAALPDAEPLLERARALAADAGDARLELQASNALASIAAQHGDLETALERFRATLTVSHAHGFDDVTPMLHDNIGIALRRLGYLEEAAEHSEKGFRSAFGSGHLDQAARALANLSEIQLLLERVDEAEASARRAIELADRGSGATTTIVSATTVLGQAAARRGRFDDAVRILERAVARCTPGIGADLVADAHVRLGHAFVSRGGSAAAADAHFDRALEVAGDFAFPRALALWGRARLGHAPELHLRQALSLIDVDSPEAAEIRVELERVLSEDGVEGMTGIEPA